VLLLASATVGVDDESPVGLHFFNPVQLMKLVEVIHTDATDPAVFALCKSWADSLGKSTVGM
jgi:3-hydroxyacyl-CoA dehydrogenase